MSQYDNMPDEQAIAIIMHLNQCDEADARFILALERGEIEGDAIEVKDGEEDVS